MNNPRYSVYLKKDDVQCAAAMGVTPASFDSIASRIRHGKVNKKWDIIRHDESTDSLDITVKEE